MSTARQPRLTASLRAKLLAFVGGLLLLSAGGLGHAFYRQSRTLLQEELSRRGESLAHSLAFHAKYGVITRDDVQLLEVSEWALSQPGVKYVQIADDTGEILLRRGSTAALAARSAGSSSLLAFAAPVVTVVERETVGADELLAIPFDERLDAVGHRVAGTVRGQVEIGVSTVAFEAELGRLARRSTLLVAVFLLVGGTGLFVFLRVVIRPIRCLVEATDRIAAGELGRRVIVRGSDEIARLGVSFNAMGESLLRSRQRLARHEADLEERVRQRTIELERANDHLRSTQQQLLQAEKLSAIGRLVSGVAHELNNPLAAVLGNAELIEASGERAGQRARVIHREAERCRRIVQDLLTFARSSTLTRGVVDLNHLVAAVLATQGEKLRSAGIEVELRLAPRSPRVAGDPHRLEQVVVNLLTNSHDALLSRPGSRRIIVRTIVDDGGPGILVSDNGPGIPPDQLSRIFDPFFTTKPVGQGTGLGLALCYGIVREHAGRIRAFNNPDGGASFLVVLEPAAAEEDIPPVAPSTDRWGGGRSVPTTTGAARGTQEPLSVLVVDDEPAVAEMLEEVLALAGHRVTKAANGHLALEHLASTGFDLVLSDLRMPGLDGMGLRDEIGRAWPEMLDRLVFITGDQASDESRAYLARTGARCLGKPFTLLELEQLVANFHPRVAQPS